MLIDFSNPAILSIMNRDVRHVYGRMCTPTLNFEMYKDIKKAGDLTPALEYHVDSVLESEGVSREYYSLGGAFHDSHNEIEKLGTVEYFKGYVIYVPFTRHLGYVLSRVSGCSRETIENLPNYLEMSRAVMLCDIKSLDNYSLNSFMGHDKKLDLFISSCNPNTRDVESDEESSSTSDPRLIFFGMVFTECSKLLNYIGMALAKQKMVARSFGFSNVVLSSTNSFEDNLTLQDSFGEYDLEVYSMKPMEYLDRIRKGEIL